MRYLWHLTLALLMITGPGAGVIRAQTTWDVPDDGDLDVVINTKASSGQFVRVSNNPDQYGVNQPYDPITMKAGVTVYAKEGESPKISGTGAAYAVDFPTNSTTSPATRLEGFEITAGSVGGVRVQGYGSMRGCTITVANKPAVVSIGHTTLEDLTITVTGTLEGTGIDHSGGPPDIRDCVVTLSETNNTLSTGILVDAGAYDVEGVVEGCELSLRKGKGLVLLQGSYTVRDNFVDFTAGDVSNVGMSCEFTGTEGNGRYSITDCYVSVPWGVGLHILDDSVKVSRVTVVGVDAGIWGFGAHPVVENCIVSNYSGYAYQYVDPVYCIADGSYPWYGASDTTGSRNEDPLFCDPMHGAYTLRIDSWGNPENNHNGRIGAYPVACAGGELVRSTTVGSGTQVLVTEDLTVPADSTLTLRSGVTLTVSDADASYGGADEDLVELIVNGNLVATGTAQDPVTLAGAVAQPGSWWGINVTMNGSVAMDGAKVKDYATFVIQAADTSYVIHSEFSRFEIYGLQVGNAGSGGMPLLLQGNSFLPYDAQAALWLMVNSSGVVVVDNDLVAWDEPTGDGIWVNYNTSSQQIVGNYVSGFTVAAGLGINQASPDVLENEFESCMIAIDVTSGDPRIGLAGAPDSANIITGNETGIRISDGEPVVRLNRITGNRGSGVVVRNGADPDLGTQGDPGMNTFLDNESACIKNENPGGTPTVRARGNYFGECDALGDPEVCWVGSVDSGGWTCVTPSSRRTPEVSPILPGLRILGASPNPTATGCGIHFDLGGVGGVVTSEVYDVAGRLVRKLPALRVEPGEHRLVWDGLDDGGRRAGSGMYFVKVSANGTLSGTAKVLVGR